MIDKLRHGAVVFDDKTRPLGGWACVAGDTSFRVRGTGDLSTDVVWWTNLQRDAFIRIGGLNQPKLRRSEYLRPNMDQLMTELGLHPSRLPSARIVETVAEIFSRVLRLAQAHYGIEAPGSDTLLEELYGALIDEDRAITPEIDEALRQATQTWVKCEVSKPSNSQFVTFRRPRLAHALDVLATPIPGEQWEFVKGEDLPPARQRVHWLVSQPRPVLAKVSLLRVDHEIAPIVAFGSGARGMRGWMTQIEILYLARFAKLRVDAAFLGSEYVPFTVKKDLYRGGMIGELSICTGILAENYMCALMSARPYRKGVSLGRKRLISPRAAWLCAADRFYSMNPALMLHGSGFSVLGYGRGQVILMLQRGALEEARMCATAAGALAPLYVSEEIAIREALAS